MKISCYAAPAKGAPLEPFEYESRELGPGDVEVRITHSGICHSDIHLIDNDWGISKYPLVPGHEIVGVVTRTGPEVRRLKVGDRAGIGWQSGSCRKCEMCATANENLCDHSTATCVNGFGGYATSIIMHSHFAIRIPDALASENAAPLLCGGITVYTPLRAFDVRPEMRVGVIGIGGLGHIGIQFLRAYGCEVTAFSTSPDKETEAKSLGAHHFVPTSQPGALASVAGQYHFILSTVSADLPWPSYIAALRPKGRLCIVGVPNSDLKIPAFPLIGGQKSISGSPIGSPLMIREMLDFAARNGIKAKTESMPMHRVNEALAHVRANKARYRMVLTN
ncbi:MAG: NAD(P)-dependent alcohol dehydrogenase [Candidatus Sumerlaeaceae bacterium]|nr:NAD(P)-dependent alcohol dehydrogenase [Candidatus Sumerlaeaceae bacterium]